MTSVIPIADSRGQVFVFGGGALVVQGQTNPVAVGQLGLGDLIDRYLEAKFSFFHSFFFADKPRHFWILGKRSLLSLLGLITPWLQVRVCY